MNSGHIRSTVKLTKVYYLVMRTTQQQVDDAAKTRCTTKLLNCSITSSSEKRLDELLEVVVLLLDHTIIPELHCHFISTSTSSVKGLYPQYPCAALTQCQRPHQNAFS